MEIGVGCLIFLSTLSLRRATNLRVVDGSRSSIISIHALLAESDLCRHLRSVPKLLFLSTLSLRRATANVGGNSKMHINFYPRSPCGERRRKGVETMVEHAISIHALLAESDKKGSGKSTTLTNFYPRSPCGERLIQIKDTPKTRNFYPRSPCGERQPENPIIAYDNDFYPRSPCGERRRGGVACYLDNIISIHALLAESDPDWSGLIPLERISIHALLAESDLKG